MSLDINNKNNKKIIGSIIKFNRTKLNISQKQLAKGICVPSYLSRIENGELLPSEDVISVILSRLGLNFCDSPQFIAEGKELFASFFENLNYNEFDCTNKIFAEIELKESEYITSPLIIDYLLVKLARYCSTLDRDKFEDAQNMLLSSFELLSPKEKSLYNFYVGLDTLLLSSDKITGKNLINKSLAYKETGHCYFWLSYAYRLENNPIKAYDCIKKALDFYVSEGNLISIMSCYEKFAEVYFMLDNYNDAIHYLKMSSNIAKKIKNEFFIEHLNSLLAWTYYRIGNYDAALSYINNNNGIIDHRMVIPDSVIKALIYFSLNDKASLKTAILQFKDESSIVHLKENVSKVLYKLFNYYIENDNYIKDSTWGDLLVYIIDNTSELIELRKVFAALLKEFYISNRRYKDALSL